MRSEDTGFAFKLSWTLLALVLIHFFLAVGLSVNILFAPDNMFTGAPLSHPWPLILWGGCSALGMILLLWLKQDFFFFLLATAILVPYAFLIYSMGMASGQMMFFGFWAMAFSLMSGWKGKIGLINSWLLPLFLATFYITIVLGKIGNGWLEHNLIFYELAASSGILTSFGSKLLAHEGLYDLLSWSIVGMELLLGILLLLSLFSRKLLPYAVVIGVSVHVGLLIFIDISYFPFFCLCMMLSLWRLYRVEIAGVIEIKPIAMVLPVMLLVLGFTEARFEQLWSWTLFNRYEEALKELTISDVNADGAKGALFLTTDSMINWSLNPFQEKGLAWNFIYIMMLNWKMRTKDYLENPKIIEAKIVERALKFRCQQARVDGILIKMETYFPLKTNNGQALWSLDRGESFRYQLERRCPPDS